jgi:hypothetical protein
MSEGLGAFEEHVSYRPGQQIGTMRTLMKWHAKGAKFYIGADTQPRLLDWCTLGDIASCLGAGEIRLAERVTVKTRVPEPVAQVSSAIILPKDVVLEELKRFMIGRISDESFPNKPTDARDYGLLGFLPAARLGWHEEKGVLNLTVSYRNREGYDALASNYAVKRMSDLVSEYCGMLIPVIPVHEDAKLIGLTAASAPKPEPVAEPESRPIPTCETCPARVESCTAPGVFQCRLHPAPSSPLRDKHFCFQHPALAGLMQPVANPAPDECDEPERFLFSGKGRPVVTAPPIVIQPDSPFHPPFEVTCKENGTC